jgi:hypothetical protein
VLNFKLMGNGRSNAAVFDIEVYNPQASHKYASITPIFLRQSTPGLLAGPLGNIPVRCWGCRFFDDTRVGTRRNKMKNEQLIFTRMMHAFNLTRLSSI